MSRLEDFLLHAAHDPVMLLECYQNIDKAIQRAADDFGIELSALAQDVLRRTPREALKIMIEAAKKANLSPSGKEVTATVERTRGIRPDVPSSRR